MQHMQRVQSFGSAQGQKGFTIIELVVVILLLGILAATALPRFIDVTDEAHDAAFEATVGGFTTGVAMYRAQYIANGQPSTVTLDNAPLEFNGYGYPAVFGEDDATDYVDAQTSALQCEAVFNSVLQAGRPSIDFDPAALEVSEVPVVTTTPDDAFDVSTAADADFRIGFYEGAAAVTTPAAVPAKSPVCYYIYTAQYGDDAAAVAGGRTGVPFFTYAPYTGAINVGHTSDL